LSCLGKPSPTHTRTGFINGCASIDTSLALGPGNSGAGL
jgi:hypothetical protein